LNRPPLNKKISVRYSTNEEVDHLSKLKNDRFREALTDLGFHSGIELATFTDVSVNAGLGSSSSFSVGLMKALHLAKGRKLDPRETAEEASRLEIELVGEPIGKQDQYASAHGGLNVFQFNKDESVDVFPVHLDYKRRYDFENHTLLFFTGMRRLASSVLIEQNANAEKNFETLKRMADSVPEFEARLTRGDFKGMGEMLHEGWLMKRTLASNLSNAIIDDLYATGMKNGVWGGKILGAGGGGCIMFLAPLEKKEAIRCAMAKTAKKHSLEDFSEIPVHFVQSGVEVIANNERVIKTTPSVQ
ncbi:MAG: GHMP kinase, partial [Patescibacteria group bacterium]